MTRASQRQTPRTGLRTEGRVSSYLLSTCHSISQGTASEHTWPLQALPEKLLAGIAGTLTQGARDTGWTPVPLTRQWATLPVNCAAGFTKWTESQSHLTPTESAGTFTSPWERRPPPEPGPWPTVSAGTCGFLAGNREAEAQQVGLLLHWPCSSKSNKNSIFS